jgi:hypothetical protein
MIAQADKSALKLVDLLVSTFEDLFDDSCLYNGKIVCFYKRAQILVADLW